MGSIGFDENNVVEEAQEDVDMSDAEEQPITTPVQSIKKEKKSKSETKNASAKKSSKDKYPDATPVSAKSSNKKGAASPEDDGFAASQQLMEENDQATTKSEKKKKKKKSKLDRLGSPELGSEPFTPGKKHKLTGPPTVPSSAFTFDSIDSPEVRVKVENATPGTSGKSKKSKKDKEPKSSETVTLPISKKETEVPLPRKNTPIPAPSIPAHLQQKTSPVPLPIHTASTTPTMPSSQPKAKKSKKNKAPEGGDMSEEKKVTPVPLPPVNGK